VIHAPGCLDPARGRLRNVFAVVTHRRPRCQAKDVNGSRACAGFCGRDIGSRHLDARAQTPTHPLRRPGWDPRRFPTTRKYVTATRLECCAMTSRVQEAEEALRASAREELPALGVAERASEHLASIIEVAPVPVRTNSGSPSELQHEALWLMSVLGFRAMRAAIAATCSGYGDQAVAQVRVIIELHARARKAIEDESGEYPRQWLADRAGGSGARLIGQDFWEFLSGPPHGTVRAVLDWTAISREDGTTHVVLGPERRPEVANPTLTFLAGTLRDIAHWLATIANASEDGLETLDAEVKAAYDVFIPDGEPGTE
jgi:hypothetical protein